MSHPPTLTDLKNLLSRSAKLNKAQAALPPAMRGLLPVAIGAGGYIAKVTNGDNFIERQILGKPSVEDDFIALPEPEFKKELPEPPAVKRKNKHYQVESEPADKTQ
ncbi:hypothetical protein N7507_004885 [Penicillium longicatenatum]|nr:hypothetical protein N7507_004885 [Penicillium longicatenatum]